MPTVEYTVERETDDYIDLNLDIDGMESGLRIPKENLLAEGHTTKEALEREIVASARSLLKRQQARESVGAEDLPSRGRIEFTHGG